MIEIKLALAISLTHGQSLYSPSFSPDFFILLKSLFLDDDTVHKELGCEKKNRNRIHNK